MSEIKFLKGEYANYKGIASKDENAFYVTNEEASVGNDVEGKPIMSQVYALWLGTHLIASGNTAAMLVEETKNRVAKDTNLEKRLAALESGDNSVEKQIERAIADLKAEIEGELAEDDAKTLEAINDELDAIDEKIETLNGDATTDGSVAKAVADAKAELLGDAAAEYNTLGKLEDQIQAVAAAAKSYQIEAITEGLATNVKEAFKLVDEDGVQAGATINIYKDSSLEKVEMVDQILKFTYILNDGSKSVVDLDVSDFLAETEFKDGLDVIEGQVFVNVANASSAKTTPDVVVDKNFLQLEADGDGNKALAVRSIDTDCTVIQKPISVAGISGQLGSGIYKNGDIIPAGTDVYTILRNILSQELYPKSTEVKCTSGKVSASLAALTLTLDKSSTIEVGTKVTMNAGKTNGSSSAKTASTVVGMTYGWSAADDDSRDSSWNAAANTGATSVSVNPTSSVKDNVYTVSATINSGFNADTTTFVRTTPTTVTGDGSASLAETVLGCAAEGDNKITINATGASYDYSIAKIDGMYYCSNLGNTDASAYTSGVAAVSSATTKPTNTASQTVKAQYKYFLGYSENVSYNQFDSDSVRALTTKTGWVTVDGTTTIIDGSGNNNVLSNGKSIVIACPKKYKLASIANGVGANIMGNFVANGEVTVKCGEINVQYMVYVYPITNGATVEFKNVTLTKA